ncbi:MAG TPA: hypothetical protein VKT18_07865, partial [Acidimicrobiales bacterium]|nr:hypothetical protein [Acidimicrobiales bacterium]
FADLDHYLAAPRAHAPLEALRAVGLAGRLVGARGGSAPGHVLVQTRQPDHPAVASAVRGDPSGVLDDAAATAATLGLPPHVALCALRGPGAAELGAELARRGLDVTADATSLLVSAPTHRDLCDALESAPRPHDAVRVEVDPPGF